MSAANAATRMNRKCHCDLAECPRDGAFADLIGKLRTVRAFDLTKVLGAMSQGFVLLADGT